MLLNVSLELVEIRVKTVSILPMLLGVCLSVYYYHSLDLLNSVLFFITILSFSMAADMTDNCNDCNHVIDTVDHKKNTNIIRWENISPRLVPGLLFVSNMIVSLVGTYLVTHVGLPLLWMGIFCFTIGILYSSGPFPLLGLPAGESASGFTVEFMITLISVFINVDQQSTWSWASIGAVFLVALPNELWIFNLSLANSICDADEDEDNRRHTIIHFIEQKNGLYVFTTKNVLTSLAITFAAILHFTPWTVLLTLLIIPFVVEQTRVPFAKQVKKETFPCAVKILLIGSLAQVVTPTIGLIQRKTELREICPRVSFIRKFARIPPLL